ncbi:hypothetical protein EHYA_04647 [Embleya hyalina]|uniref:Uncharacterized protein n=1 Tax=Embleya hyalina TaxID=516124 RepID=A0A401YQT3_9ACTN|nr:hypothetical protein EHYA_04647 [Embleya hyalina]
MPWEVVRDCSGVAGPRRHAMWAAAPVRAQPPAVLMEPEVANGGSRHSMAPARQPSPNGGDAAKEERDTEERRCTNARTGSEAPDDTTRRSWATSHGPVVCEGCAACREAGADA